MFVLHIELVVTPGLDKALESIYSEAFCPAVSAQAGFAAVQLLRSLEDDTIYQLILVFDRQASQQAWVATDLHKKVWSMVASQCTGFSVKSFSAV